MIRNAKAALVGALTFGGLSVSLLFATPVAAEPKLPVAVEDQIRYVCEASSADLAGKREERRCRAEWRDKLQRLSASDRTKTRLVLR